MTEQATAGVVRHSVTVPLSRERAFELFVDGFSDWWPKDSHHISERPVATAVLEAREGGRWYERDDEGDVCEWGSVLALDRPARIVIGWQLSPDYRFDPDVSKRTEVEVVFEAQGGDSTRVTLEHRGFEVHGVGAAAMRDSVDSEGGWPELLDLYAKEAAR